MDHIGHMPIAYSCALDTLGNGDRTSARLTGLIDHFERATGLQATPEMFPHLQNWRDATHRIAARRYYDFAA